MIWKIRQKGKLNSDKIWTIWKKGKLKSDKIWKIQKKIVKRFGNTEENGEMLGKIQKKIMKRYRKYGTKVI